MLKSRNCTCACACVCARKQPAAAGNGSAHLGAVLRKCSSAFRQLTPLATKRWGRRVLGPASPLLQEGWSCFAAAHPQRHRCRPEQTLLTWPAAVWAGRCVRHWVRFLGSWLGVAERIYLLSGFGLPFLLCVTPQLVGCGPWAACSSRAVCTWLPGWGTSCGPPQGGAGKGGGGGTQKELPHHSRVEGRGLSLVSLTCLGPGSPKAYWSGWYVPGGSAECFVGDPRAAGRLTAPSQINERCTELLHSI